MIFANLFNKTADKPEKSESASHLVHDIIHEFHLDRDAYTEAFINECKAKNVAGLENVPVSKSALEEFNKLSTKELAMLKDFLRKRKGSDNNNLDPVNRAKEHVGFLLEAPPLEVHKDNSEAKVNCMDRIIEAISSDRSDKFKDIITKNIRQAFSCINNTHNDKTGEFRTFNDSEKRYYIDMTSIAVQ